MTTDASSLGWGASLPPHQASGSWDSSLQGEHINVLELQVMFNALRHILPYIKGKSVTVRSDNSTAVAYIKHQGGTRSPRLCLLAWDLLHWTMDHKINLHAIHIAGSNNSIADALSRGKVRPTEWTLQAKVAQLLFSLIDRPHIDLFASAENFQLPVFCTRFPHPQAWATDALHLDWTGMLAYAFPPITLIPVVLSKIERERCKILLIAPFWPRQPWFLRLTRLLVFQPIVLPIRPDILYQPKSGILHPAPAELHLTCWTLSNDPSAQQAFLSTLQPWPHGDDAFPPRRSITAEYNIFLGGAKDRRWLQPRLL